jgi:endonuclease G
MSPQEPNFNRHIWKKLEDAVRQLDAQKLIFETYVICGPIFKFDTEVSMIGTKDNNGVTLPIPHAYYKSVLTENHRGALHMWSFVMDNESSNKPLDEFLVPTTKVEKYSGLHLWERLVGTKIKREKKRIRKMWKL